MTSILPSFPHLLHTLAQTLSSRGRLDSALFPLAFTPVSTPPEQLVTSSVCPSFVVLSKVLSVASMGQILHISTDTRFPNWGPQRFCLSISRGAVRMHMNLTPNLLGQNVHRWGPTKVCRCGPRSMYSGYLGVSAGGDPGMCADGTQGFTNSPGDPYTH